MKIFLFKFIRMKFLIFKYQRKRNEDIMGGNFLLIVKLYWKDYIYIVGERRVDMKIAFLVFGKTFGKLALGHT